MKALGMLAFVVSAIAGIVGYILNIIALTNADFSSHIGMLIVRVLGIFIPFIGAIAGWL